MLQRLKSHHRPEVRAADADIDHVTNGFTGVAFPLTASHAIGEIGRPVEHGVDLVHHVLAVHDDRSPSRRPEGHMQNGPVLGDIDPVPPEHGVYSVPEAGLISESDQEPERFVRHAVFRVIEEKPSGFHRHALAPCGIVREKSSEMQVLCFLVMSGKGFPCIEFSRPVVDCRHVGAPFVLPRRSPARRASMRCREVLRNQGQCLVSNAATAISECRQRVRRSFPAATVPSRTRSQYSRGGSVSMRRINDRSIPGAACSRRFEASRPGRHARFQPLSPSAAAAPRARPRQGAA